MYRNPIIQIRQEPDLTGFVNSNPARAGFENQCKTASEPESVKKSQSTLNDRYKCYMSNRWLLYFKKINVLTFSGRRWQQWSVMMSLDRPLGTEDVKCVGG